VFKLIKALYAKLFYDPYKFVKKYPNISIAKDTILLKSTKFRINEQNKVYIGEKNMLGCTFIFESEQGEIEIGNNTFIHSDTNLIARSKIKIGNNVMISWGCTIYDHNSHSLDWRERVKDFDKTVAAYHNKQDLLHGKNWEVVKVAPITIEDKVWMGFGCTILSGVRIGEGAVIGANSVVRQNVEPWTVVAGNPAVVIKRLDHE
jgi:galactoside O-acetyltransferase